MPTYWCWVDDVDKEIDADQITRESSGGAATALLEQAHERGELPELEDDDSFTVITRNIATDETTKWSVTASVSVTFGARLIQV